MTSNTQRNYLIDNLKAILIICVLCGHVLEDFIEDQIIWKGIYGCIYLFHMELFIFTTGYFSKKPDKAHATAIRNYLFPYIFFNLLAYIVKFLIDGNWDLSWINPAWSMWYLFVIFAYRYTLKYILRIPFHFLISIILSLAISTFDLKNDLIFRFFAYLPFFLLGYYVQEKHISVIRKIKPFIFWIILIMIFGYVSYNIIFKDSMVSLFYNDAPYDKYGMSLLKGIVFRTLNFGAAAMVGICLLNLLPSNYSFLSNIGANTGTIYIFHTYFVRILKKYIEFPSNPVFQWLLLICIPIIFILSYNPFTNFAYHKLSKLWGDIYDICLTIFVKVKNKLSFQ